MSAPLKTILVSVTKHVGLVILNRPKKYNAFNGDAYLEFANALKEMDNNSNVHVIVVTGNGKYFSSGNDLSTFAKTFKSPSGSPQEMTAKFNELLTYFETSIMNIRKPIICGVNGPAIGIACTILNLFDIVYASNTATFNTPFSELGQSPEGISSLEFPRKMGFSKANEVLLLGIKLNAQEAKEYRLISEVWDVNGFRDKLLNVAYKMAEFPPNGLIKVKKLIRAPYNDLWKKTIERENELLVERWQSNECKQAIMKFYMKQQRKKAKKKKLSKL